MDDATLLHTFRFHLSYTTIAEVARATGLNRNTIRALKDGPHGINSHTRAKLVTWIAGKQNGRVPLPPVEQFLADIHAAYLRAERLYGRPLHSAHEAYGLLLEHLEAFWDEVRKKEAIRDTATLHHELMQVAAMCLRTVMDLDLTAKE